MIPYDEVMQKKFDVWREIELKEARMRRVFAWMVASVIGAIVGLFIADLTQSVRAEPAAFACEAKRMGYRRVSLTTTVICVPKSLDTRNDTVTVRVPEEA